ncbi:MAG: LamG domain-containing protein, partial [Planctomycetota bacterium]
NFAAVANDVDLTNIAELLIGFGDKRNPVCGPEGVVIFDDIRLYMPICKPELGPAYDFSGNCIVDMADIGYMAGAWLRHDVNFGLGGIQEPNDANLVGWWRLDGDTNDSSIYDHNSTIEGTYAWVTGHNDVNVDDLAVQFTGSGGRVLVPDNNTTPELRPEHQVSASVWVYSSQRHDYGARVVVKGKEDEETYELEVDDDDHHTLFRVRDANEDKTYTAEAEDYIPTQEWLHMAGTYDGNTAKLYVNGELWASVNDEDPNKSELSQDTNGLAIGNQPDDDNRAFKGTIDEVRVYDYGLLEAEVRWLASDGTGYVPLTSLYNLYDKEKAGEKAINFRDLAMLLEDWLKEGFWPPEE